MRNLILVFAIFVVISCSKNNDSKFNVPRIVIKGTLSGSNVGNLATLIFNNAVGN